MTHHELTPDGSFNWLLHERYGADLDYVHVLKVSVARFVDRVFYGAWIFHRMILVDLGTVDGALGLRAIERMGNDMRVIFTNSSAGILRHTEQLAKQQNVASQCGFLQVSAESLAPIQDSSVDAVVARTSIAYIDEKQTAFRELYRVLKPGGRLSIAEPLLQDEALAARALKRAVEAQAGQVSDGFIALLHRWKAAQFPDTEEAFIKNPLVNFSERDLLKWIRNAGFNEIHLQLAIDVTAPLNKSWDVFLNSSPHSWAPSLKRIWTEQFSEQERRLFESVVRPMVESGGISTIDRIVYLNATK
jgi:ubiquinone/menaquinone biosynthesis C-methylase UbiE